MNLDTTSFVASWVVVVVTVHVGVSCLTVDAFFEVPEGNLCIKTSRKGNLPFVGISFVNFTPGKVGLRWSAETWVSFMMTSMQLLQNFGVITANADLSSLCRTVSAKSPDIGEPIGLPLTCW